MLPVAVLLTGLAVALLAPLARRTEWGRGRIPSWTTLAALVPALAVSATLWAFNIGPERLTPATTSTEPYIPPVRITPSRGPLQPGEKAPPLIAGGWVNGEPPLPGSPGAKLVVIDLWAMWCPLCQGTAKELVDVQKKYADRQVAFIGLTNMSRLMVETYVRQNAITYPNAFDVPNETIDAFGAANGTAPPIRGYEIAPVLILLGPDGIVKWSDGSARFRHQDPKKSAADLDAAIEKELAALPK